MAEQFSADWARDVIESNVQKAETFMDNPEQIDELLGQLQEKLQGLPDSVENAFSNVPLMAQLVKSYITREYTAVSPKVVASLVGAFLYFVKKDDIIPDSVPLFGYADDLAVAAVALLVNEPELKAFADWQNSKTMEPAEPIEVDPLIASNSYGADIRQ